MYCVVRGQGSVDGSDNVFPSLSSWKAPAAEFLIALLASILLMEN